jgi:DNA-binding MarR family transcriptional regulator
MIPTESLRERAIDRFWETVPPLWNSIRSHIRATATANFDISVEQFHVLRYVRRGTDTVSDLATAKNISRPAISQAVEVLVKKGLLTRVQSKEDRRSADLVLTKAGNNLLDTVFQETRGWMNEQMQALSPDELETVLDALEIMKKMLAENIRQA